MADMPKRPVLSPVDYDAWSRGYMPPSEHILIDQLMFRGARIKFSSDGGEEGAFWLVVRNRKIKREWMKRLCELLLDCWEIEECSLETTSQTTLPTTTAPATEEATAIGEKTLEETATAASTSGGADDAADTGTR